MKRLLPFAAGLLLGFLCASRLRPPVLSGPALELALDIDEMASPSFFRRTVRLRSRPAGAVSKGSSPAA